MFDNKKINLRSVIFWIIGMIICPLGVAFSTKSGFGVSMIEAPVYVLHLKVSETFSWFTFGTSEYIVQGILLVILCVAIRHFHWRYLLSFVTAVLYGFVLDGWNALLAFWTNDTLPVRILCAIIGILLTAFAVACFFRTNLPQEVWELFVKELTEHYKLKMTKVKWIFDISLLTVGIVLMLIFFHEFRLNAIGIGTIVTTAVNAPIIGLFGKIIDKVVPPSK